MDEYRATLRRWMTNMAIVAVLFAAAGTWYAVFASNAETLFLAVWFACMLMVGTFVLITLYFLVLGYLSTKSGHTPPNEPNG